MAEEFKFIKEKDKLNLLAVIKVLEFEELKISLRGSSAVSSDYQDIDLNVWDTRKHHRENKEVIEKTLRDLGVKNIGFRDQFKATWIRGRWYFNYNDTHFDLIYTPWGESLIGYEK